MLIQVQLTQLRILGTRSITGLSPIRCSQYDTSYVNPIVVKKPEEFTDEVIEERRFSPVKAAVPDENCFFYTHPVVKKFITSIMRDGDKNGARFCVEMAFRNVKLVQVKKYNLAKTDEERREIETNPTTIFLKALENCTPLLLTKKYVRGGSTYQIPWAASEKQRIQKGIRFLREVARDKKGPVYFKDTLAKEILEAYNNKGRAVQKKQELHRICEANRAYAHYRWSA